MAGIRVKLFFLFFAFTLVRYTLSHDHGHGHDHGHSHDEPAHFKYSKHANEQPVETDNHHDHSGAGAGGHDHGHGHAHDEVHPGHGHAHDEGHHGHGHAHDEDHPGHGHAHEEGHHGHGHAHDEGHPGHGHAHDEGHHGHGHAHDVDEGQHGHSHNHGHSHDKPAAYSKTKRPTLTLWAEAIGSTALVSIAPIFILIFIPLDTADGKQPLLKVLLSFASGGLLGDAFLHLIPHAISPHSHGGGPEGGHDHSHQQTSHDHGHSHADHPGMAVGMWVLAGIVAFLIVEKFVRYVKGGHGHSHGSHGHSHTATEVVNNPKTEKDGVRKRKKSDSDKEDKKTAETTDESAHKGSDIKVAGYLNLAADFAHNFTDGLAIGASYLAGQNIGIITTITIMLHEIPHEIGDFAILVQSGCTKKKAMMLQFTTAIGAMTGTLCSLMAQGIGEAATAWILPFTAGGFIYIATVSVIPELLEDSKIWQSVKEITALLIGVFMMVLIAEFE